MGLRFFGSVPCTVHGTCKYVFNKFFFKTRSQSTINTFKNYFIVVFSSINFQQ